MGQQKCISLVIVACYPYHAIEIAPSGCYSPPGYGVISSEKGFKLTLMELDESAAAGAAVDLMISTRQQELNIVAAFRICFCMICFLLVSDHSDVGFQ